MMMQDVLDYMFTDGKGSGDDTRFKYSVGQFVRITLSDSIKHMWPEGTDGTVGKILSRRNAYPEPHFTGYWFPIYFIDSIGEVGETQIEVVE